MIDSYIEECINGRKDVCIITINGFQMRGRIVHDFADHVILLSGNKKRMVYKHAISTICPD